MEICHATINKFFLDTQTDMQLATANANSESFVSCQNSQGVEIRATLLKLARFQVAFELYTPACVLRISEVLSEFKITINSRILYSGRAVIISLVNVGTLQVCEVKLEDSWLEVSSLLPGLDGKVLRAGFGQFLNQWHQVYKIAPEYKAIVADMHTFLADLRLWLDQVELGIRSSPTGDRIELELELSRELGQATTPALGELFERFESVALVVENECAEQRAAHSAFAKRMLHPLLLGSPFLYRTFHKPLGYAGDYEMVNMICREPLEGSTLFAKIVNLWFLRQPPAEAHRNRVKFLVSSIAEATARAAQAGRPARIVSIGCGPAVEVQQFLIDSHISDQAEFFLIDFNEETIQHAREALERVRQRHHRSTRFHVIKKSVNQILKEASRTVEGGPTSKYDLVYCAGLFDYLSDQICQRLVNIFYDWVLPGGLLLTTNVDSSNPRRLTMDYVMDWHLNYRGSSQLAALKPDAVALADGRVLADSTGVNIHYVLRKPNHG